MSAPAPRPRYEPPSASLTLLNGEFGHGKANLIAPTTRGYLYIAATVEVSSAAIVLPSSRRAALLGHLKAVASRFRSIPDVIAVDLFRAIVRPPAARFSAYLKRREGLPPAANFDVSLLIQTSSVDAMTRVQKLDHYLTLIETLKRSAKRVYVMPAENVRRIGDVDTATEGLFLFNHFVAEDRDVMLELWDYLAGWYAAETGLQTSIALMPIESHRGDFAIVNWARWDQRPLRHFWQQLSKRGFWKYVTVNLEANQAASMPIYCRLA